MSDVRQLRDKQRPLSVAIRNDILQKAKDNAYIGGKLPSEEELCAYYNVSRATIREALTILHREGFISKRHGTGNFLNYSAINATMRFDLEIVLPQILEQAGHKVFTKRGPVQMLNGTDDLRSFIKETNTASPLLEQVTKHIVNDVAAIITYNYFTYHNNVQPCDTYADFMDMVSAVTGKTLSHTIQAFIPMIVPVEISDVFGLGEIPVVMWHQKHYSLDDDLVCESYVFFNPSVVLLHSLTRWM